MFKHVQICQNLYANECREIADTIKNFQKCEFWRNCVKLQLLTKFNGNDVRFKRSILIFQIFKKINTYIR